MSDFLASLAARSMGSLTEVAPRQSSWFETGVAAPDFDVLVSESTAGSTPGDRDDRPEREVPSLPGEEIEVRPDLAFADPGPRGRHREPDQDAAPGNEMKIVELPPPLIESPVPRLRRDEGSVVAVFDPVPEYFAPRSSKTPDRNPTAPLSIQNAPVELPPTAVALAGAPAPPVLISTPLPAPAPIAFGEDRVVIEHRISRALRGPGEPPVAQPQLRPYAVEDSPVSAPRTGVEPVAPTIQVTIGRIEVRASTGPARAAQSAPARSGVMPLNEYLRQRKGGH